MTDPFLTDFARRRLAEQARPDRRPPGSGVIAWLAFSLVLLLIGLGLRLWRAWG